MKMSLGKFIAIRRKNLHMTQEELASKLNVSKSAVAKWETDGGVPDRDNLYKLAEVMSVSVNDLHRIKASRDFKEVDFEVNITLDIIKVLENYGYTVIRPEYGLDDGK